MRLRGADSFNKPPSFLKYRQFVAAATKPCLRYMNENIRGCNLLISHNNEDHFSKGKLKLFAYTDITNYFVFAPCIRGFYQRYGEDPLKHLRII